MVEISIIVPVFNEADNILPMAREVAAAMQTVARPYELVFVDDASRDATWEKIQEARRADARVRGMRLSRNSGQSAALWTGIQATTSPILATLDGDLQNDPADLPRLLAELVNYDFICGARQKRQDNFLRRASTKVARWARKTMLKVDFADTGCAARAFKRTALHGLWIQRPAPFPAGARSRRRREDAGNSGASSPARGGRFKIRNVEPARSRHLRFVRRRVVSEAAHARDSVHGTGRRAGAGKCRVTKVIMTRALLQDAVFDSFRASKTSTAKTAPSSSLVLRRRGGK